MIRKIHNLMQGLAFFLTALFFVVTCTLDIITPIEPPLETWDSALNTAFGPVGIHDSIRAHHIGWRQTVFLFRFDFVLAFPWWFHTFFPQ